MRQKMTKWLLVAASLLLGAPAYGQDVHVMWQCGTTGFAQFCQTSATNPLPVSGSFSSAAVGATGAAVPASADYVGINVAGTLTGWTGAVTAASGGFAAGSFVDFLTTRGTKAAGTAATNSLLAGGVYNSGGITLADTQQSSLQLSAAGELKVVGTGVAIASTTSGQTGSLVMGAVTTSAPTYTTAQTDPLSLTTAGGLRTDHSSWAGTALGTPTNFGTTPTAVVAGSVNASMFQGTTAAITGGVAGSFGVGGTVATNVAITANPLNLGAQAVSSENTAVTTARQVQLVADLVGKLIVLPYSNPENFVKGTTAAMTATTSTSIIASAGGSLKNYVTDIYCVNSHATVSTFVNIQDGSGGTTIYQGYAAAVGGGFGRSFLTPIPTSAATGVFAANVTTGANVVCNAVGYKGV